MLTVQAQQWIFHIQKIGDHSMKIAILISVFATLLTSSLLSGTAVAGPKIAWKYYDGSGSNDVWVERHKRVIRAAMIKVSNQIATPKMFSCIFRNTNRFDGTHLPRRLNQTQRRRIAEVDYSGLANIETWPSINIIAMRKDKRIAGRASMRRNWMGYKINGRTDINEANQMEMDINLTSIDYDLTYNTFQRSVDRTSGAIMANIAVQMGYDPTNSAKGYPKVSGRCMSKNGVY